MRFVSQAELQRLLGRLQFAVQCYPVGRQQLHATWRLARVKFRTSAGEAKVSAAAALELRWWADELSKEEHEGVPLARCDRMPPPGDGTGVIYADASGEGGFSAWTVVGDEVLATAGLWSAEEKGLLICDLELLASTFGLVAFEPWMPRDVYSFTDNTVAMAAMRSLRATSPAMQVMLAERSRWMMLRGIMEEPRRITSENNVWADVGSRPEKGGLAEVERQARALGLRFREVAVPPLWRDTAALLAASDEGV